MYVITLTRIRVIAVNFYQRKRNLVRVSGEFELSEFKLTKLKCHKSGVKFKENGIWFELAGIQVIRVQVTGVLLYYIVP